jgi:hypothetical protein
LGRGVTGWRVRVIDPVRIQEPIVALLKLYPLPRASSASSTQSGRTRT